MGAGPLKSREEEMGGRRGGKIKGRGKDLKEAEMLSVRWTGCPNSQTLGKPVWVLGQERCRQGGSTCP